MATPSKPEPPPATKNDKPGLPVEPLPPPVSAAARTGSPWLPAILAIVLAPVGTWGVVKFVLLPQVENKLAATATAAPADAGAKVESTRDGHPKAAANYEFNSVVVNLAGTMGTRYLKTSFHVLGDVNGTEDIRKIFDENRSKLYDTTLNVLSSLTLADLEEPGAKNVIREKLVSAYNQALGRKVADQVYFSEFVVQ